MSREPKIDRKALRKSDGFVEKGRQAVEALFREKRVAAIAVGVLALAVGGYYAYDAWYNKQLNADWTAFYKADEAKPEERIAQLKQVYEKGGRTRAAFLAAVTVADHYAQAAELKLEKQAAPVAKPAKDKKAAEDTRKDTEPTLSAEQAAQASGEWYGKALGFSSLLPGERELLTLDVGVAAEREGKWDVATEKYKAVVDMGGESKPLAMLHLGRMHEHKKETDAARKLYESISKDFSTSEFATMAKNYLRKMDSALLESATGKL